MKTQLHTSHYLYLGLCFSILVLGGLHEFESVPTGYLNVDSKLEYAIQMCCILITLGGSWLALRLFTIKSVKKALDSNSKTLTRWNIIRILTIGIPILINLEIYYALCNNQSILYCFLITLLAFVFCWPDTEKGTKENPF